MIVIRTVCRKTEKIPSLSTLTTGLLVAVPDNRDSVVKVWLTVNLTPRAGRTDMKTNQHVLRFGRLDYSPTSHRVGPGWFIEPSTWDFWSTKYHFWQIVLRIFQLFSLHFLTPHSFACRAARKLGTLFQRTDFREILYLRIKNKCWKNSSFIKVWQ
jgi:hypothetical protein